MAIQHQKDKEKQVVNEYRKKKKYSRGTGGGPPISDLDDPDPEEFPQTETINLYSCTLKGPNPHPGKMHFRIVAKLITLSKVTSQNDTGTSGTTQHTSYKSQSLFLLGLGRGV